MRFEEVISIFTLFEANYRLISTFIALICI